MAYSTRNKKCHNKKHSRSKRCRHSQKGGAAIISPATYSNYNNAHFPGKGFTDPTGAVTGCTGGGASNIYTTIGGVRTPVTMNGGRRRSCAKCNQRKCLCKNKNRMRRRTQRGGRSIDTNGYSIGGIHLKPSLSALAPGYHIAYNSCKV
jgi:hypothetical protein